MKYNIFIYSILTLVFSSCIKEIDWEGQSESNRLVVIEGLITSLEEHQIIKISRTLPVISNNNPEMVSNAVVSVSSNTGNTIMFKETEPGIYSSINKFKGVVNEAYTLTIVIDGEEYSSSTIMVEAPDIEPLNVEKTNIKGEEVNTFTLRRNFGANTPYKYKLVYTIPNDPYSYYPDDWEAPEWFSRRINENDTISLDTTFYVHSQLEPAALLLYGEFSYRGMLNGSKLKEYIYSMTDEHYEYIRAILSETEWRGVGVVDNVPANVPTNISNGAIGFFAASEVKILETIIE